MAAISDPLASFAKLDGSIYLQDPDSNDRKKPVIFIAFWMNAPVRAIAKYLVKYRRLVPSSRIIFIRSTSKDFLPMRNQTRRARVAPVVEAMRGLVTPENPVFLHIFSNGGLNHTAHLLQAWKMTVGTPLPILATILDSAPGTLSLRAGLKAFSYGLPQIWILRLIGKALLLLLLIAAILLHTPTFLPHPTVVARGLLNDRSLVRAAGPEGKPARCYIYSDSDDLVEAKYVEAHASDAEAKGWVVRRELYKGSPHVGHMRAEPDRYWSVVQEYLGALVSK